MGGIGGASMSKFVKYFAVLALIAGAIALTPNVASAQRHGGWHGGMHHGGGWYRGGGYRGGGWHGGWRGYGGGGVAIGCCAAPGAAGETSLKMKKARHEAGLLRF
jgi:hypothetical protein